MEQIKLGFNIEIGPSKMGYPMNISVNAGDDNAKKTVIFVNPFVFSSVMQVRQDSCIQMIVNTGVFFKDAKEAGKFGEKICNDFTEYINE